MADNIDITPGTGKTVATDDCGAGGHTQIVKLAISTDGSATYIPATVNGMSVQGQVAHDAAQAGNPVSLAARASAAAPADVSADNDAVNIWALRNGSLVVNLAAAGALIPGDATNGLKVQPSGNVAHDAADSGNPIKIGAKAETSPAGVTLVADGDRTDVYADADGIIMTKPYTSNADLISEAFSTTVATETASTNFGATASCRNHITCIHAFNTSATPVYVELRDGAGGTVFYRFSVPAAGGVVIPFPTPLRQPTANTALYYDPSAAVSTLYVNLTGFKSKA